MWSTESSLTSDKFYTIWCFVVVICCVVVFMIGATTIKIPSNASNSFSGPTIVDSVLNSPVIWGK